MSGLARQVERSIQQALANALFTATVVSSTATSVTVRRYASDATLECAVAESYVSDGPAANEEVLVAHTGGGYVVLCRVLR